MDFEPIKHPENLCEEKARWIEEQAQRLYDFMIESRIILDQKAQLTAQWLYAIFAGSGGYALYLLNPPPGQLTRWWLFGTCVGACIAAACLVVYLVRGPLQTTNLTPPGAEPVNVMTDAFLKHEPKWMRLAQCRNVQQRIQRLRERNHQVGDEINLVRWLIVIAVPVAAILGGLIVSYLSSRSGS